MRLFDLEHFFGAPILLEEMTDRQIMNVQIWVFGRHFLKIEQREADTLRKTTGNIFANVKI